MVERSNERRLFISSLELYLLRWRLEEFDRKLDLMAPFGDFVNCYCEGGPVRLLGVLRTPLDIRKSDSDVHI
jgi:hypothetical protein